MKKLLILMIGILLILNVGAEEFRSASGSEFSSGGSYQYSTPQLHQPGFLGSNHGFGVFDELSSSEQREICMQRQDFIIQIAPGGCVPAVVRSDLLAERNVPVFCKLQAIQANPTITPEEIRSMVIVPEGDKPDGLANVGYFRPLNQISREKTPQGFLAFDNVGYAVFLLKRQENERDMPDFISGSLSARLNYDIANGFGLGLSDRVIPVMSDSEWAQRYLEYAMLDGKAYLRVDSISNNQIKISIYADANRKIDSFTVLKGKESADQYLPGNFCNAAYKIKYEAGVIPETSAVLRVGGKTFDVVAGEKFANGLCRAGAVSLGDFGGGSVNVVCNGKKITLQLDPREVELIVSGSSLTKKVGDEISDGIYLGGLGASISKGVFIVLVETENYDDELKKKVFSFVRGIEKGNSEDFEGEDGVKVEVVYKGDDSGEVKFSGFSGLVDLSSGNADFEKYFNSAVSTYRGVEEEYNGDVNIGESKAGEVALGKALDLAELTDKVKTARDLKLALEEHYDIGYSEDYIYDVSEGWAVLELDGFTESIRLVKFNVPSFEDKGVVLEIGGVLREFSEADKINGQVSFKSFDEEGVKFVGSCKDKVGDGENLIRQGAKKEICGTEIAVRKINLERFAKISVSTNNKRMGGVVNFSYGIGIEKRAIELSPEKTSQRIANLNESIERWEDINDNLGSVVKGMKAACFATSAALQVKNLFSGMGGVAMARQAVMQGENGWNNFCDGWEKEGYVSSDDCYSKNGKAIESDVKTYASELEKINDAIEEIESGGGITEGGTFGKVVDSEKSKTEFFERFSGQMPDGVTAEVLSYEQMKDFVLYDGLKEEGSEQMNEDVKINLANLNSEVDDMIEYNKRQKQLKENVDSSGLSGVANIYAPIDDFTESRKTRPYQTLRVSEVNKFPGSSKGDDVAYVSIKTNNELKIYLVGLEDVGNQGEQYRIPHADAKVFEETGASWVKVENETVTNKIKAEYTGFRVVSSSTYSNEYKNPEVRYYESAQYKGVPAVVPFDLVNGWYAATQTTLPGFGNVPAFKESGQVSNFLLCNVGSNGKEQFPEMGDDECITINPYSGTSNMNFLGMSENKVRELSAKARSALKEAANQYKDGVRTVKISGKRLNVGNPAVAISGTRCQDFMSPADCKLLFNVCDPVICPSSRCDLGGKYHVDNVVQSGIVGSIFLCLPNIREGIAIPICLTGVHAGIENYVSILKASRSCLQENLDSGKYVGICDQITAVYKCEFFWNQISPLLNTLLPKLLEMAMGGGTRGGGEYMFVQSAWDNMQGSIDSFKQNYAINTIKSFNIRSTQEVGNEVCKSFISTRFPNSFKSLVEPDSPSQFTAWFDEIPMTTATTPSRSQYKVFYHIFAGEDQGSYYSVYLKDAPETSYYSSTGGQVVATGYINKGEYASESVDFEGVSGFQQLCVRVNYQEECGFKRVSTGFALNYLKDKYIEGQMTDTVKTQKECISGSSDGMAVLAGGLNPQALATESLQPEIYKRGIIRVCATSNPGAGADTNQWREVGYCDNKNLKCWLDTNSIEEAYTTGNYGARNRTTEALDEIAENLDNDIEIDIEGTVTDKVLKKIKEEIDRLKSSDNLLADARVVLAKIEGVRAKIVFSNQHALADYLEGRVYDVLARSAWKEVVAKRQVARAGETVSCEDLGGTWKGECEDNEVDKTSELNDESSTTENSNKKCCVLKEHGTQGENLPPDTMLASYVDPTPVNLGGLSDFEIVDALTFVMEYAKENPIEDGDGNSNNDRKCNCGDDCGKYAGWIVKHSEQNNINNPLLVLSLIMQESSCKAKGSSGSSVGLMQINLGYWCEEYGLPSDKTECKAKLIDFPEKNIYVGTKILKSYFDIFDSKSCSNEDDCGLHPRKGNCGEEDCKIKCEGNICKYQFKGCDRDVYYYGWGAALRAYNGWGCLNSYLEQDDFVEEISGRYENLANLFVNYLKEDQAVSIVA